MFRTFCVATLIAAFAAVSAGQAVAKPAPPEPMPRYYPKGFPTDFYKRRGLLPVSENGEITSDTVSRIPRSARVTSAGLTFTRPTTLPLDLTSSTSLRNSRVVIRNTGKSDIRNPWVIANNTRNWFDSASIAREAVGAESDPERRAFRIWDFVLRNRYHWHPAETGKEIHSPVKFLNVYGYGFCDDSAVAQEVLWKLAGFAQARCVTFTAHVVSEVFYHDDWHMFDADMEFFYPSKDGKGAASVVQLAEDRALVDRVSPELTHILTEAKPPIYSSGHGDSSASMAMILRPGESLERCHYNWGKFHDNYHRMEPPLYGNGRQTWKPDLVSTLAPGKGFSLLENITWDDGARALDSNKPTAVQATVRGPYVFVGGSVSADVDIPTSAGAVRIQCRKPGRPWISFREIKGPFAGPVDVPLDRAIDTTSSPACYSFEVRVQMTTSPGTPPPVLRDFEVTGEIQCAPWSLPTLIPGEVNQISATFLPSPGGNLEVEFDWIDSPMGPPPPPPSSPITPADNATVSTDTLEFAWESHLSDDPNVWREIVVSWDPDGFHPVSPHTTHRGRMANRWTIPPGWLIPGHTYYWRVRSFHEKSKWSPTWKFTYAASASEL